MTTNEQKLREALALALADRDFMGNNKKVDNAIEALTPKDSVTSVLKRLQGNARRDFLDKKDSGANGYTDETRNERIKEYVLLKFKVYMDDPRTSVKATELFNSAYGSDVSAQAEQQSS